MNVIKNKRLIAILCLACFMQSTTTLAVKKSTQAWPIIRVFGKIKQSKWRYFLKSHLYVGNKSEWFNRVIFRGGMGYAPNSRIILWLGTDVIPSLNAKTKRFLTEQRVWQEAMFLATNTPRFQFLLTSKLEQRFLHGTPGVALRWRQRFTLRFLHLLSENISPVIYDELFFNLNHPVWVSKSVIDKNRVLLGIKISAWKNASLTIGYVNEFRPRKPENMVTHIILMSLNIKHNIL